MNWIAYLTTALAATLALAWWNRERIIYSLHIALLADEASRALATAKRQGCPRA